MSFRQIRKIGGTPSILKELTEKLARLQADVGIEDVSVFWNGRVDTDGLQYSDSQGAIVNENTESSTSMLEYSDDPEAVTQDSGQFEICNPDGSGTSNDQPIIIGFFDIGGTVHLLSIIESVTASSEMSNSDHYSLATGNTADVLAGDWVTMIGEKVNDTNSILYNQPINTVIFQLVQSGALTGTATAGVWNSTDGAPTASNYRHTFGTIDVSTIGSAAFESHGFVSSKTYILQEGDVIGVFFDGGSIAGENLAISEHDSDPIDGSNSILSFYDIAGGGPAWADVSTADIVGVFSVENLAASNVIDGNTNTWWINNTDQESGAFIFADQGKSVIIKKVRLYFPNADRIPQSLDIYITNDTNNWGSAIQTITPAQSTGWQEFNITSPDTIRRYLKLQVNVWGSAQRWALSQFEVRAIH